MRLAEETAEQQDGFIDPQRVYTTVGLKKAIGLARESVTQARASGIVKARKKGKQLYYRGDQIIKWIFDGEE